MKKFTYSVFKGKYSNVTGEYSVFASSEEEAKIAFLKAYNEPWTAGAKLQKIKDDSYRLSMVS